mmetsp:Transcript_75747/g.152192  ORF Transcript_75747/g.152192 Transcript_75747/m.152192 type:complete len:291 (-) Transcript_75747:277-1149(-)
MKIQLLLIPAVTAFVPTMPLKHSRQNVVRNFEVDPVLIGGGVVAAGAVAAVVSTLGSSDTAAAAGKDDLTEVREYFNNVGFERWNKIYSESDEVNKVQMDIRDGHQQTIDTVLKWVDEAGNGVDGKSVCDLGCGVGSLAIPLAQRGAAVSASDISSAMSDEAARRAKEQGITSAEFSASDLESVNGKYDTVTCIDVMIHYPTDKMKDMVTHLASLSDQRLFVSFAPKTTQYVLLKKVGELFPGPSKTTRAYLHPEESVREALASAGFKVKRSTLTATNFYFSTLFEAVKI